MASETAANNPGFLICIALSLSPLESQPDVSISSNLVKLCDAPLRPGHRTRSLSDSLDCLLCRNPADIFWTDLTLGHLWQESMSLGIKQWEPESWQ